MQCNTNRLPPKRRFLPLTYSKSFSSTLFPGSIANPTIQPSLLLDQTNREKEVLRVLQFNALADGLSGSRADLGDFSRTSAAALDWQTRKSKLLHEITQYQPDIITMQEVDHYHDFFLPELASLDYVGFFAPKPVSPCLLTTSSADGCAIFLKSSRLRVITSETKTIALAKAALTASGELQEEGKRILAQNQVSIITVCELIDEHGQVVRKESNSTDEYNAESILSPPIIIATTHLKAFQSPVGERHRALCVDQVLTSIQRVYQSFADIGRTPVVLFAGDFNASPEKTEYDPEAYRVLKNSKLDLRSVYNEDLAVSDTRLSSSQLYTAWRARKGKSTNNRIPSLPRSAEDQIEQISKRCIDYIFYLPFQPKTARFDRLSNNETETVEEALSTAAKLTQLFTTDDSMVLAKAIKPVTATSPTQIAVSSLLRLSVFLFGFLVPLTSFISTEIEDFERLELLLTSLLAMGIFEKNNEGSIFKPIVAQEIPVVPSEQTDRFYEYYSRSDNITVFNRTFTIKDITTTLKQSEKQFFSGVASLSQQIQPLPQYGRPGFLPLTVLDLFSEDEIGESLLPSEMYPSDHLAIGADLELLW